MLHIVLGILKMIGIAILLVLLLLLIVIAAVLFVPVRYRIGAVRQGEKLQLQIGFSWLLRMVSAAFFKGEGEELSISVRLFGFRLPFFQDRKNDRPNRGDAGKRKQSSIPEYSEGPEEQERAGAPLPRQEKEIPETDAGTVRKRERPAARGMKTPGAARRLPAFVKEKARQIRKGCISLRDGIKKLGEYEIGELLESLAGEVLYLLKYFGPRRIRGYLRFGTGDPALTGVLTGLIFLILPARADQFAVTPDFYETVFETEIICTGYIRAVHLARTALRALRDKRLRKVITDLKRT